MTADALVTGSRGFFGSFLVAELRRRHPKARLALAGLKPARGVIACDLRDARAARRLIEKLKPSVVFHLAGSPGARLWEDLWEGHVTTTINLLDALRGLSRPVKVVIAGSAGEYGAARTKRPLGEESPPEPITAYGAAKLAQTYAALSYRHEGLEIAVARVFNLIGPGTPERMAPGSFANQLARIERGLQPPHLDVGDLRPSRDFVDVRDAAQALADLARPGVPGGIYNVCSGRAVAIGELLRDLIALSGLRVAVRQDPARKRGAEARHSVGSRAKLTRATGWAPRVPLERSLRDMLDGYRADGTSIS